MARIAVMGAGSWGTAVGKVLADAGSGVATLGLPSSPGVTGAAAALAGSGSSTTDTGSAGN